MEKEPLKDYESLEEELYHLYIMMRKKANIFDNYRYDNLDKYQNSNDFKKGFLMGSKITQNVLKDLYNEDLG